MQREEDGDYEDREGENMYAEVEDPYITDKEYKCEKCNKKKKVKSGMLFAPFCHDRPMKLIHRLEHKFDFETIAKRSVEKEKLMFPNAMKNAAKKMFSRNCSHWVNLFIRRPENSAFLYLMNSITSKRWA